MISFDKINGKDTEYRMSFGHEKHIDLFLSPRTPITNNFEIIILSIQKMSEVIDNTFDEFICCLLSDYQDCDSDERRYNLLSKNVRIIAGFVDYFIENNGIDYAEFSDKSKRGDSSIFFDKNEIKKIIKLSEALKIYSLISNTEIGLNVEYHKKIYNDFIDVFKAFSVISKIFNLLESLAQQSIKTVWHDYENLSYWSFIKVTEASNIICNKGLIICQYDRNPIPFFIEISNNIAQWRDPYKEDGIIYEGNDKSQNDKDDNLLPGARINIDVKRLAEKDTLNKLNQKSFDYLNSFFKNHVKSRSLKKGDSLSKHRLNQIEYISPFWEIIIAPILSKFIGIKYKDLLKLSPKIIAAISFYLGNLLKPLCNYKFNSLFGLSAFYPESKVSESTSYRLSNVSHFINSTLNISRDDLIHIGGSRIKLVRIIEDFIGKMKTGTVKYRNILTGQYMQNIYFGQIEEETIDYWVWLLEAFRRENVTFDPNTGKPRKECQPKEDREPMTFHELISGEPFPTRTHITSTLLNIQSDLNLASTDSESFNIQYKREKLKERMDQIFKIDIFTLLNSCNLNPIKSFVSQLLKILIDQLPVEISVKKLSGKNIGIIQDSFEILIEGKVKDISLHNIDNPFSKYENLVHYMAKENVPYDYERKDPEIYIIEREILLSIISKSWRNFTKKERKEFYVGLCDSEYLNKFFLLMPFESHWTTKGFNYTLFRELFGSNSTAFLKIAALIANSTYFYFFDKDIPIKLNEKHKMWRALFRDKIIKSMQSLPYSKAFMATLGCVSCISLLRQIEFFKDKGITLEDTQAFEINPKSIFLS